MDKSTINMNSLSFRFPLISLLKLFIYLLIFSFLSPYIREPFLMKYDYIILLLAFPFFMLDIVLKNKADRLFINIGVLLLVLFFNYLISDVYGYYRLNNSIRFVFPSEFIQIFNRLFSFYLFYYVVRETDNYSKVIKLFSLVFVVSLLIGISQYFLIPYLNDIWVHMYSSKNTQDRFILNWWNIRVFGVLGHPIKWSGIALFMTMFFLFLSKGKIRVFGIILSIINLFLAGSKSGILAGSVILLYILIKFIIEKGRRVNRNLFVSIVFAVLVLAIIIINTDLYSHFVFRFSSFLEKSETNFDGLGRVVQIKHMFSQMINPFDYFFGLGRIYISNIVEHIEVEPFYIFGNYGILGLINHYFMLVFFYFIFYKNKKYFNLGFDFFSYSLVAYLLFSFGYYFFREINGGYQFWMISGAVYAKMQLNKEIL